MLRLYILLNLTCLLIFWSSNLRAVEVISSSTKSRVESDVFCANTLQRNMSVHEILRETELSSPSRMDNDEIETFTIEVLWNKIPDIRRFFQNLTHEINYIKRRSFKEDYNYKKDLIDSILNLARTLSKKVKLTDMKTADSPPRFLESHVNILINQVQQLQKLIDQLGGMSPVESFIYTDIVNRAAEYVEKLDDISQFDLALYLNLESNLYQISEQLDQLNLSTVLNSQEQRRYLFQQYQLLQRYPNRTTEFQNNHSVETEREDNSKANINLAQSLRMRSIDPIKTHIPEFADLIDEHIDFVRTGIARSKKLSDSEKTKRLELLDILQSKAQSYKNSEKVTYLLWFNINLKLSIIASADSNLLEDNIIENLYFFMLKEKPEEGGISLDSFREWIIEDNGSGLFKIAGIFKIFDYLQTSHNDSNNSNVINHIASDIGLNLNFSDIKDLYLELKDDIMFIRQLARQVSLEPLPNFFENHVSPNGSFDIDSFYSTYYFGAFIEILNEFPERIMISTIADLEFTDINKTYGTGVHLIGLRNGRTYADNKWMSPVSFFFHDIEHSEFHHSYHDEDNYDNYFISRISFSEGGAFRQLVEELFYEDTHELSTGIKELIPKYRRQQKQTLFSLVSKLGNLTESEELELQKTILMLTYLELISDPHEVYKDHENIEFTEENIKDNSVFKRFIIELYRLYEQELTLNTLNNN